MVLVIGVRVWLPEGWSDAIAIASRDDTKTYRCDPAGSEVWSREAGLIEVINELKVCGIDDTAELVYRLRDRRAGLLCSGR